MISRPRNDMRSLRAASLPVLLVIVAGLISGCRAPLVNKEYRITIYQLGYNSVASDVLKETDVSPQLKASLK